MMSASRQRAAGAAQRVAQVHHAFGVAFHAVQQAVHQRQAAGAGHQFHAQEGFVALELRRFSLQVVQLVGAGLDVGVGGDQEAAGAGGRVLDGLAGWG
jgi:hypothetical protein